MSYLCKYSRESLSPWSKNYPFDLDENLPESKVVPLRLVLASGE